MSVVVKGFAAGDMSSAEAVPTFPAARRGGAASSSRSRSSRVSNRRATGRRVGDSGPDQTVAGDETGQLLFAPAIGAYRAHRQHQVTEICRRVVHVHLNLVG